MEKDQKHCKGKNTIRISGQDIERKNDKSWQSSGFSAEILPEIEFLHYVLMEFMAVHSNISIIKLWPDMIDILKKEKFPFYPKALKKTRFFPNV